MTRGEARAGAAARLRASGDASALLDADVLLAHVLGITKEELYAHLEAPLDDHEAARYRAFVHRRADGEPVAYLRGFKEFYGLRFAVDARVLIPRPETEVLVEAVLAFLRRTGRTLVADVGTGSGAIAVAVAVHAPLARVIATDASLSALEVARANASAHDVVGRVDPRYGDLLEPVEGEVDVVAANLPYLLPGALDHLTAERTSLRLTGERTSLRFEPGEAVLAGGPDGLDVVRRCIAQLPGKLAAGGAAYFECDPPQASAVERLLRAAIGARTRVFEDLSGAPRVVAGERS